MREIPFFPGVNPHKWQSHSQKTFGDGRYLRNFARIQSRNLIYAENQSLIKLNSFGLDVNARYFATVNNIEEAREVFAQALLEKRNWMILGGGSNVLFTRDFSGLVVQVNLKGLTIRSETANEVFLEVGAGENWHETVMHCVSQNWGGIENLSLIPGLTGAAPIQNIGAYGVEIKEVLQYVKAMNLETGTVEVFENKDCRFGYRNSIFKNKMAGKYLITSVVLVLQKKPKFNISYGAISTELKQTGKSEYTIKDMSDAVIRIRKSKLPDPALIGNAGSFFKNPELDPAHFAQLKSAYNNVPSFEGTDGRIKVPAAWLIEQAGWKGKRFGNYGVHEAQALVLVNYGGAKGSDILDLSERIRLSVFEKFGVEIEREVNVV
jgi:UDP-N-acetylmuramate dehydrogenase